MRKIFGLQVLVLSLSITVGIGNNSPVAASLIGDKVTVCANFTDEGCPPNPNNPFSNALEDMGIVGDGTEFDNLLFSIDLQDSMFVLGLNNGGDLNDRMFDPTVWKLSDLNWIDEAGKIQKGKIVDVESTLGVPEGTTIDFTDNSVTVNIPEVTIMGGVLAEYKFNLKTEHEPVPEPATLLGTATALGFGSFLKRKRSQTQNKSKQKD